jgi:glycosyltransferase involved in cell wall biosynthesis
MSEKKTIFVIADHPLAPSGVGIQTRYYIDTLLRTGKYRFICFGGAIKHPNYDPQNITDEAWDDGDFVVYPVDGYGNPEQVRSILWQHKPDMLWFMTDPRFYGWLWQMENEIRPLMPMVYYHVWDNYPAPKYNAKWYDSTDVIASISKVTHDIVSKVSPDVENHYLPHAVDQKVFRKLDKEEVETFKEKQFPQGKDKFVFFWNNRNARRKQSGTVVHWFNKFADEVGPENVCLLMHTDPRDPNGQDLELILRDLEAADGRVILSREKLPAEAMSMMYNMADCTLNISDAEGFGLATLESLACGTPIIVNMTGGLQEQVTDGEEWFGIGIEPASSSLIGSQQVPYIYEDRVSEEDFVGALRKMYEMSEEERAELGDKGLAHVDKNYSFEKYQNSWLELTEDIIERFGSWENRKEYKSWDFKEIR